MGVVLEGLDSPAKTIQRHTNSITIEFTYRYGAQPNSGQVLRFVQRLVCVGIFFVNLLGSVTSLYSRNVHFCTRV